MERKKNCITNKKGSGQWNNKKTIRAYTHLWKDGGKKVCERGAKKGIRNVNNGNTQL
jgi:hypothetical protein